MTKAAQVEILDKYAEVAESLLQQYFPNEYTAATIAKLAERLIDEDVKAAQDAEEKEIIEKAAQVINNAFLDELQKLGWSLRSPIYNFTKGRNAVLTRQNTKLTRQLGEAQQQLVATTEEAKKAKNLAAFGFGAGVAGAGVGAYYYSKAKQNESQ